MAARTGIEGYATEMGELWSGLARTLAELDRIAAAPEDMNDRDLTVLRRLQYRLHLVAESVHGLAPPAGAAGAHAELGASLADARDATGEVADALEDEGPDGVSRVVHEWRGALFRVRLARLRLSDPPARPPAPAAATSSRLRSSLSATALVVLGAGAFAFGAAADRWPVWLAGMLAVCAAALAYRP
ncbi:MAG: hypothetical protein JO064_06475 [Actinobacteria bacterium]|nr:hypothetical protein [Actinomycetota bacterium]